MENADRCPSINLNLTAFGSQRTPWPFLHVPFLLEDAVLTPKPVILLGEAQIFFRNHIRVSVRRNPFVQRRHANTQIISNLLACQSTRQRDTYRILAEFVRPFQSHSQSPLLK